MKRHCLWAAAFVILTVAAIAWRSYEWFNSSRFPGGSTNVGLVFGVVGGVIILFEMLLWVHKWRWVRRLFWRWIGRPGRIRWWMAAHIWLGLASVPFVLLHAGFPWGGYLTWVLMLIYVIVILSGIFGLWLQNWLPTKMKTDTESETVFSQLDVVSRNYSERASALVLATCGFDDPSPSRTRRFGAVDTTLATTGIRTKAELKLPANMKVIGAPRGRSLARPSNAGEEGIPRTPAPQRKILREAFEQDIEPYLRQGNVGRGNRRLSSQVEAITYFNQLRERLDSQAHPALASLERWCDHRRQFDKQRRYHGWLHGWLSVHLPLSIALVVLLFTHVVTALRYR